MFPALLTTFLACACWFVLQDAMSQDSFDLDSLAAAVVQTHNMSDFNQGIGGRGAEITPDSDSISD